MASKSLFILLLLPGMAQAVICKTVGPDGVTSFTNLPTAECPQGSLIPDHSRSTPLVERAGNVDTRVSGRAVSFAGYDSIGTVSPSDGATVRSNEGNVKVLIELDPELQANHIVTAYVDGRGHRGRFGSPVIDLTGIERGIHQLRVAISDASGKKLIESGVTTFTVMKVGSTLTVNPVTGDNYISRQDPATVLVRGLYKGSDEEGTDVSLWFPVRERETRSVAVMETKTETFTVAGTDGNPMQVVEIYNWEIGVPRRFLATESSFEARARTATASSRGPSILPVDAGAGLLRPSEKTGGFIKARMTSTHSVAPGMSSGFQVQEPSGEPDYNMPGVDYSPHNESSASNPGTNPAFTPNYGTR